MTGPSAWARRIVGLAHAGLLIALPAVAGLIGGLLALPLLLPVRGLWQGRSYTYAWCSLLVVIYLGGFLMEAFTHPGRRLVSLALAAVAAAEFCALLLFVRLRAAERRRAAAA
jgi:uncharacterized membrane protein